MSKDARLPSVRVEIEGLVAPEVDAPEVGPARSSSPARAGVLTLAVLVALGAGLLLLSLGGEAEPAITQEDEVDAETISEQFALTANGGDFHLSIAQSINAEEEQLRVTAKLLQTPVSSLRGWMINAPEPPRSETSESQ